MNPKYYGAAAQYNKPVSSGTSASKLIKIIALVVGSLIIITIGFFVFTALTSAGANNVARLVARERTLLTFITNNQATLSSDSLKTVNSNAISLLTSDSYALQQGLKTFGLTAVPEEIAKSEVDTTSAAILTTAKVQSRLDTAYIQLLRDKIAAVQQLSYSVLADSSGTTKTSVQTVIAHLRVIDEQLSKLEI